MLTDDLLQENTMRRGTIRKLINKTKESGKPGLTWAQATGAFDPKAGVAAYRTIEGREYKEIDEKVAVSRLERAAERRLAKRNKRRASFTQGESINGEVQAPQEPEVPQAQPVEADPASGFKVRFDFE